METLYDSIRADPEARRAVSSRTVPSSVLTAGGPCGDQGGDSERQERHPASWAGRDVHSGTLGDGLKNHMLRRSWNKIVYLSSNA